MEDRINKAQAYFWLAFGIMVSVSLAINGIQSIFMEDVEFAYWHLGTPVLCWVMFRCSLTDMQYCRFLVKIRWEWRNLASMPARAARFAVAAIKAFKMLPALFAENFNRFQTEP